MTSGRARSIGLAIVIAVVCLVPALAQSAQKSAAAPARSNEVALADLPREARQTLELIKHGGPFPYRRDGIVFGNFERRLPLKNRGYYHEYTVPTPGARDRGARRIITGAPGEYYYTDDHYETFRRIKE
jgi:ribonuclease T1